MSPAPVPIDAPGVIHRETAGAVVRCEGLTRRYGDLEALSDLSLEVAPGEVLGLLGPNGAGKTTALRILTTMLEPTSGRFSVAGHPGGEPNEIRRRVGVFPENSGYPDAQTGREVLEYHARLHGHARTDARDRSIDLLAEIGLLEAADATVRTYSRGMRQRLGLARALVNDPVALFLDEPTLGLDPAGRAQVLLMIGEAARRRGVAVIVSTHDLEEIERICDRAAILSNGRLIAQGTIDELRRLTRSSSRAHVAVGGDPRAAARILSALGPVAGVERDAAVGDGLEIAVRADADADAASAEILGALLSAGIAVRGFGLEAGSLESVFLALTADAR